MLNTLSSIGLIVTMIGELQLERLKYIVKGLSWSYRMRRFRGKSWGFESWKEVGAEEERGEIKR